MPTEQSPLSASLLPLSHSFSTMGPAYVIPIYQRPYSWKPSEIERLFDDVLSGLERAVEEPQALTFLGSTITTSTPTQSEYGPAAPPAIRMVIDGQQRLCTFVMAAIVLHNEMHYSRQRSPSPDDTLEGRGEGVKWILNQSRQALTQLRSFIFIDTEAEYDDWPRLPRIIRAGEDQWATTSAKARYRSPIARLERKYTEHYEQEEGNTYFSPQPPDEEELPPEKIQSHKLLVRRYKSEVRDSIRKIVDPDKKDWELPSYKRLRDSNTWAPAIIGTEISLEQRETILEAASEDQNLARLLNYVLLARFMMEGVHIAAINSTDESYALDMFDSLNTTGQPLTALETFKPRVVAGFGTESDFLASSIGTKWASLQGLVERKPEAQQKVARDIVKTFALAETGRKLPLSLSDQRSWLRDEFEAVDRADKYYFVTQMLHNAGVYQAVWPEPGASFEGWAPAFELDDSARLAIDFMSGSNHTIPQASLSRYTFKFATAGEEERIEVLEEVKRVARACAAFWAIWRAASASTENIDAAHREIMADGVKGVGLPPLSRRDTRDASVRATPSASDFIAGLRSKLTQHKGIRGKADWVEMAGHQNHDDVQEVARFLLLAAFHSRGPDPDHAGLLRDERTGPGNKTLSWDRWLAEELSTLEHVAPQKPPKGHDWDEKIYRVSGSDLHALGNLVLLPSQANAIAGNKNWATKRRLFEALSAKTIEEAHDTLSGEDSASQDSIEKVLAVRQQLPVLGGLSGVEEWSEEFIEARTEHLLDKAWDTLAGWIEFPSA